jgi:hypothetical protein
MREYGERLRFPMFVFEFRKVLLAWLILAEEEHRRFGKGPAQMGIANLLA